MARTAVIGRERLIRAGVNLAGAAGAALFARASILYYLHSHLLIGAAFFVEQACFVVAFLVRRPARTVTDRTGCWLLAAAGTFAVLLLPPAGLHLRCGLHAGLDVQLAGVALAILSLAVL